MDRTIFHEVSDEEGWTATTQVDVLLGYIENQKAHDIFRDYLEGQRADAMDNFPLVDPADDFTRAIAGILRHPALAHDPKFQEYCATAHGVMTPEHAADSWWMRQFS